MYSAAKTLINNNDTLSEVIGMSFLLSLLLHVGTGSTLLGLNSAAHLRLLYNSVKKWDAGTTRTALRIGGPVKYSRCGSVDGESGMRC
jgi:hypothetical protein